MIEMGMDGIFCKKCNKPIEFSEFWLKAKIRMWHQRFVQIKCPSCGHKNLTKCDIPV